MADLPEGFRQINLVIPKEMFSLLELRKAVTGRTIQALSVEALSRGLSTPAKKQPAPVVAASASPLEGEELSRVTDQLAARANEMIRNTYGSGSRKA